MPPTENPAAWELLMRTIERIDSTTQDTQQAQEKTNRQVGKVFSTLSEAARERGKLAEELTRHVQEDHAVSPWYASPLALLWTHRRNIAWALGTSITTAGVVVSALYPGAISHLLQQIGALM
jgi:hypothetical protein